MVLHHLCAGATGSEDSWTMIEASYHRVGSSDFPPPLRALRLCVRFLSDPRIARRGRREEEDPTDGHRWTRMGCRVGFIAKGVMVAVAVCLAPTENHPCESVFIRGGTLPRSALRLGSIRGQRPFGVELTSGAGSETRGRHRTRGPGAPARRSADGWKPEGTTG
jgi:hypothetical protein